MNMGNLRRIERKDDGGANVAAEVKKVVDPLMTGFEEFKKTNDQRLAEIEKKGAADPLTLEKLNRIEADLARTEEVNQKLVAIEREAKAAIEREQELCRLATVSIFVSEALRTRAIDEYGLDPDRTLVSPNATEQRFHAADRDGETGLAALPGPVFGAVGMVNDRIDFDFLDRVAAAPSVASLALVGPISGVTEQREALERLLARPNVHAFGAQPHASIHRWMAGLDVAVIPYRKTPLNHFCSPMRLYDHLAIGHPILATPYCAQLTDRPEVLVSDGGDLDEQAAAAVASAGARRPVVETWDDRVKRLELPI